MSEYGYLPESPEQSFGQNSGIFTPKDIYDLTRADKYTNYGQLELIETVNASAVSSFDLSTLGTYNVHFLTYNDLYNSNIAKGFGIRLYESGVLETASVYQYAHQDCTASGSFSENRSTGSSLWQFANNTNISTYARSRANGYFYFYNLGDSSKYSFATDHTTGLNNSNAGDTRFGSWVLPQASTVDGIQVFGFDVGNITGTFSLYGIRYS